MQLRTLEVTPAIVVYASVALAFLSIFTGIVYPKPIRLVVVAPMFAGVVWVTWKTYKGEL